MIRNETIEKKPLSNVKFIDLFAGIGGFRIALESLGAKCVFSSEVDKFAIKTYKENFGDTPEGDIKKIGEKEVPDHHILCAGFPCQSFSISGKHGGFDDTRGTLFFDIARIAKEKRPKVLFLENVEFLVRHQKGKTLKTIVSTLEEIGYKVFWEVLNSKDYGVPQYRKRIFLVAVNKEIFPMVNFNFPKPVEGGKRCVKDILLPNELTQDYFIDRDDIKLTKAEQENSFRVISEKPIRIGIINKGGQGERIYSIWGQAITLSAHGGGAASKTGAYLVDKKIRKLAPRECARLMGFPDSFKIPVSNSQAWKQFGNSVVVDVVQQIGVELGKHFFGIRK